MTGQTCVTSTKEYPASGGMLIIENIAEGNRKKADIIREMVQSAYENTAGCGSQEKAAGT